MDTANYTVAAYIRLSSEDNNTDKPESNSTSNQRELIKNYIETNSDFCNVRYLEFTDDGYTGTDFNRPGYQRMIESARAGEINCIIVKDLSRLGRNHIKTGELIEYIFPFLGVRFISINDMYDSQKVKDTPRIEIGFKNLVNEFYSRDLSDKIKKVKMLQMKKGYTLWYPAYGYKKTPEDKHKIIIDDEAAKIVKRIFSMKQDGKGCTEIARILNNEGIPSPSKYKKIGKGSKDHFWRKDSIHNIIKNEVYTGATVCHKTQTVYIPGVGTKKVKTKKTERIIVPNTHDAIINKETFKNVNDSIKVRTKTKRNEKSLFSGKVKCKSCGRLMYPTSNKNYYCASSRVTGSFECFRKTIKNEELKKQIVREFNALMNGNSNAEKAAAAAEKKSKSEHRKMIAAYENKIKRLKTDKFLLYENLVRKEISEADYIEKSGEFNNEIQKLEKELNIYIFQNKNPEKSTVNIPNRLDDAEDLTRELIDMIIDVIYIDKDGKAEIVWKNQFERRKQK